jgi:arylsulfatase A-like enzyme
MVDALRAKNTPFFDYKRNTTPFLYSIRDELTIYKNAISSSYWTMPSVASLFTGKYSSGHGLVVDGDKLDESLFTLPDVLNKKGYRCAGFVNNIYVSDYSGLDKGFQDFYTETNLDFFKQKAEKIFNKKLDKLKPPGITRSQDNQNSVDSSYVYDIFGRIIDNIIDRGSKSFLSKAKNWIDKNAKNPFFIYFHIFETHSPYRAPGKYAFKFLTLKDHIKKLTLNHNHINYLLNPNVLNDDNFETLTSAYDNSIFYADHLIKILFDKLKEKKLYDNSLIIILSDHGDNIGDHNLMFHYFCLYDTLIHIPLLIKYPYGIRPPGEESRIVQNVDIFPTICSVLGIEKGNIWNQFQGNDILQHHPPVRDSRFAISELIKVFGPDRDHFKNELEKFNRRLLSIRTNNEKFIYSSNDDHEFYDLIKDPDENNNLYMNNKQFYPLKSMALSYYTKMNDFYEANRKNIDGFIDKQTINDEITDKLKSLGYM